MMPGENPSKVAGIASEAAGSCQSCTSLQQNLNEYVAALITLKQKIIDSDNLLAEYQQKCEDLRDAERENKTLRCQLEQMLQKISPWEQTEEQLKSFRIELEKKTSVLDVIQLSQLEVIGVKKECKKCNMLKKKHQAKLKKTEEVASKHIKHVKQLQQEKKIIERELKKIQKKLEVQNKSMKNAQTQVAKDQPVVKLDKKKIRILLEELWDCIESSTENHDGDKPMLETNLGKGKHFQSPDDHLPFLRHFNPSTLSCKFDIFSELGVVNTENFSTDCKKSHEIHAYKDAYNEYTEVQRFHPETSERNLLVLQDLNDSHSENPDNRCDMEELSQIMCWAKPLPHLLSPLQLSPTTKYAFGEFTDSSDNEGSDERNKAKHCTALERKQHCVRDQISFVPCPEAGNVTENCKPNVEFGRNVKSDRISIVEDCLKSQSEFCSNYKCDLTTEMETDKKNIEIAPMHIEVSFGVASNTLTTNVLTEKNPSEENTLHSAFNRENTVEKSLTWYTNQNVPAKKLDSIDNSEVELLEHNSSDTIGDMATMLVHSVGGNISGRLVIENLHCSTKDGSSSAKCNMAVHHNQSVNDSGVLFSKDSPLQNCNLDLMCSDERKFIKSLQVYSIVSVGENHAPNNITSAEENHDHNNLSVDKLMENSNCTTIDRGQDNLRLSAQPEIYLNNCNPQFNNDSDDFIDSKQSISCFEDIHTGKSNNGTSMDGEMCCAAETVQPLDEKSGHSISTPVVQFEDGKLINQYYADKIDPKHPQKLPVHKTNISLAQELALRRPAEGRHCYKANPNERGYGMQDSLAIMPASTPFHLDSGTADKENHLSETFSDKDSTCLSMEKLEDETKGKILTSLQTYAIKANESTHTAHEPDSTSTCHIVTGQCKIGSLEMVQLCSSDSNLYTLVSSEEQKAAVADVQPAIATQLDICSSQEVADQLCSARHKQCHSTFLLHNTLCSNFDTTSADGCLNKLEGKPFLTAKDMPQLGDQQFIDVTVDLETESRDQLDTVNKDLCKGIYPKKDTWAELDSALEKTNTICSLQSSTNTLPKKFNQSKVMLVFPLEEVQHFNLCSESSKVINTITEETDANQDACSVSLDSSEEENFLIRKVSYAKAIANSPVNLKKYSKSASESVAERACNVHLESNNSQCNPIITQMTNMECAGDLTACVTSENDSLSSKTENGILMEHESLVTGDVIVDPENDKNNSKNNGDQYFCEKEKETTILEECEKQKEKLVSENIQYDKNNTEQTCFKNIENEGKKSLPGKNFIWNFERPENSVNPRVISGKHKLRGNLKVLHGSSKNSFHNIEERTKCNRPHKLKYSNIVCQAVTKESHQERKLSRGEQSLQHIHVGETVLVNAATSTNSDHSPEIITKVRSEMGPPLPPLLGPLLATPPKSIHPLSPILSSSSCSSLPSPLDDLISPLPGTPFLRQVSPLSGGHRQKSPVLTTPSPAEKANRRILSSPLQFCAATPKHALPVPGRFPLSASGSSSNSVQKNSVKILDTMYPELSARARTLNILKGNVQLSRSLPRDGKILSVSQITGFKSITSTSTVFMKTGGSSNDNSKDILISSENQQQSRSIGSPSKQTTDAFLMPRSAKRLRLDTESPVIETIKNCSTTPTKVQKPQESCHNIGYCELLPDVVKDSSMDEDIITTALKKIEDLCFDLLPVIRSHIHVGTIPKVPVMRNEEKEAIYEFSTSKKSLADRFLQVVLKKIRTGKRSIAPTYLQALCRVYVGLCRQLGDIERARILCYSILKEDFPDPDRLLLFIVSSWNDIFSTYGVVSKAIQAVLKNLAKDDVGSCLSVYLNWEKVQPMNVTVLLSSILMAVQLYPDGKFQQSKQYGDDLTDSIWEYVFAVDLLCSHRKWVWTHDKIISKELWPLLDKWVKRKKGNPNVSFVSDIIAATVLRLVGHLCQMGLKEGFVTAVKNIGAVITAFLQHANEEGMPWGVQLACVYMLFDLAASDPAAIYKTLQAWKESAKNDIPPAVTSCMQELESMCGLIK